MCEAAIHAIALRYGSAEWSIGYTSLIIIEISQILSELSEASGANMCPKQCHVTTAFCFTNCRLVITPCVDLNSESGQFRYD